MRVSSKMEYGRTWRRRQCRAVSGHWARNATGMVALSEPWVLAISEGQVALLGENHTNTLDEDEPGHRSAGPGRAPGGARDDEAAVEGWTAQLGPNHPSTLNAKYNLGIVLEQLAEAAEENDGTEAAGLYGKAADMQEAKNGSHDEYVIKCRTKALELS